MLLRAHLREKFEVRLGQRIADAPLMIPIVVEHIWTHYSSRQVWNEIRAKGEKRILAYGHRDLAKAARKPGAAIHFLQTQWRDLLRHYDEVFLQPRVYFDWTSVRKTMFLSALLRASSIDEMIDVAIHTSEHAIDVAIRPGVEPDLRYHISAFMPADEFPSVLTIFRERNRGLEPPFVAVDDRDATLKLFQPSYCKLDWRLFDPVGVTWQFEADAYREQLETLAKMETKA
jgi:hypothetical protein